MERALLDSESLNQWKVTEEKLGKGQMRMKSPKVVR